MIFDPVFLKYECIKDCYLRVSYDNTSGREWIKAGTVIYISTEKDCSELNPPIKLYFSESFDSEYASLYGDEKHTLDTCFKLLSE